MHDGNVIRVDFANKKKFGGLRVVDTDAETTPDEVEISDVKPPINDAPVQTESVIEDQNLQPVILDPRIFGVMIEALIFYGGVVARHPAGWDNGAKARQALNMFAH
jgi:hypothetical protein